MGKARIGAIALALGLLLSGCSVYALGESSHMPTPDEVIGTWVHPGPDGIVATVVFNSDGSWSARDMPKLPDFNPGEPDWSSLQSGEGSNWTIPRLDDGQAARVDLGVYTGYGFDFIELDDPDIGVRFFSSIGDADEGVRFYWDRAITAD